MERHVVDTNVLIHGHNQKLPFEQVVTVPEVTQEIRSREAANRFENENIEIRVPGKKAVEEVREKAKEINSSVSETDIKLVSLAKELGAVLVTDDYHMQNLCIHLDTDWKPFLKEGIKEGLEWENVCINCGRKVEKGKCPICGSKTKKVPK